MAATTAAALTATNAGARRLGMGTSGGLVDQSRRLVDCLLPALRFWIGTSIPFPFRIYIALSDCGRARPTEQSVMRFVVAQVPKLAAASCLAGGLAGKPGLPRAPDCR